MRRHRVLAAGTALLALPGAAVAWAQASDPVRDNDPRGDVGEPPDLQRMSLARAGDGRLRATLTFTQPLSPADLLAGSGPPGSVCLRVWTAADADPAAQRPDRLVCVSARSDDELRASVYEQRDAGLPRRVGSASVGRNASGRSMIVRVAQSALGRPTRIRFAAEATRAGCARPDCVDTLPGAPRTRVFRLR